MCGEEGVEWGGGNGNQALAVHPTAEKEGLEGGKGGDGEETPEAEVGLLWDRQNV